ncbi:MAG: hypothetical protein ABI868_00910 [Acidobacteriota bacterium]
MKWLLGIARQLIPGVNRWRDRFGIGDFRDVPQASGPQVRKQGIDEPQTRIAPRRGRIPSNTYRGVDKRDG